MSLFIYILMHFKDSSLKQKSVLFVYKLVIRLACLTQTYIIVDNPLDLTHSCLSNLCLTTPHSFIIFLSSVTTASPGSLSPCWVWWQTEHQIMLLPSLVGLQRMVIGS